MRIHVPVGMPNDGTTRIESGVTTIPIDPPTGNAHTLVFTGVRTDLESPAYYVVYLGRIDRNHMLGGDNLYDAHVRSLTWEDDAAGVIRTVRAEGGPWRIFIVETIAGNPAANARFERVFFR